MAKTFDATLKQLVDQFGADWAAFLCRHLGLPEGTRAEPLDADLSVASPQADKLLRLGGATGGILHLELESSWAGDIPDRMLVYSALAEHRHGGPVYSVVILLRPEANAAAVTGELVRRAWWASTYGSGIRSSGSGNCRVPTCSAARSAFCHWPC
jgi:hypothetical protein